MKPKNNPLIRGLALILIVFLIFLMTLSASAEEASYNPGKKTYSVTVPGVDSPAPGKLSDLGVLTVKNTGSEGAYVGPVWINPSDNVSNEVYNNADLSAIDLTAGEDLFYSPAKDLAFRCFVPAGTTKEIGFQYRTDMKHPGALPEMTFVFVAESDSGTESVQMDWQSGSFEKPAVQEAPKTTVRTMTAKTGAKQKAEQKTAKPAKNPNRRAEILFFVLLGAVLLITVTDHYMYRFEELIPEQDGTSCSKGKNQHEKD